MKRYRRASSSGEAGLFFREFSLARCFEPVPFALQNPLQSEAAGQRTKPLTGRPRGALKHLIATWAVARKKSDGDDPRGTRASGFSRGASGLVPVSVAAGLRLPLLPAVGRFAIALLRLPFPPLTGCLAASGTGIPRQRVPRAEDALATFQQTPPAPRTASATLGRRTLTEALLFWRG